MARSTTFLTAVLLVGCSHPLHGAEELLSDRDSWVLTGTVMTSSEPKAIFRSQRGVEQILMLQDRLASCVIERIESKKVALACQHAQRVLTLENRSAPVADAQNLSSDNSNFYTVSRQWLDDLIKDQQDLVARISLIPVVDSGLMYGYRIADVKPGGELELLGLLNGDIITAVNGTPASQPASFVAAVNATHQMNAISIDIERSTQSMVLNYAIE